jgi:hypothetical protein
MIFTDIPPFGYRLLSHLTVNGIAFQSGLSRRTVQRISLLKDWDDVTIGVARKFINGCGFDIDSPPKSSWLRACDGGLNSIKHLQPRPRDPLWKRGAKASRIQTITRVITHE